MPTTDADIFVYKIVVDSGGAPCVNGNLLSLALCKPKIRKTAKKGSFVFGFGGKEYEERLIYIARVTAKLEGTAYYQRREYARRPDCEKRMNGPCAKPLPSIILILTTERRMSVFTSKKLSCF